MKILFWTKITKRCSSRGINFKATWMKLTNTPKKWTAKFKSLPRFLKICCKYSNSAKKMPKGRISIKWRWWKKLRLSNNLSSKKRLLHFTTLWKATTSILLYVTFWTITKIETSWKWGSSARMKAFTLSAPKKYSSNFWIQDLKSELAEGTLTLRNFWSNSHLSNWKRLPEEKIIKLSQMHSSNLKSVQLGLQTTWGLCHQTDRQDSLGLLQDPQWKSPRSIKRKLFQVKIGFDRIKIYRFYGKNHE